MNKIGPGMEALQAKVVDKLTKVYASDLRTTSILMRCKPDFKLAIVKAARKEQRSVVALMRLAIAERIKFKGEL